MDPDSLAWFYLDRHGEEFGPFAAYKMRAWFSAGYFPIGEKLLVRLSEWRRHIPVHDLWPEGSAFVGPHRDAGRAPPQHPGMNPPGPGWGFMPPQMPPDAHGYHPHGFPGYGSPPPAGPGYWPAPGFPHYPPVPHHAGMPAALGYGEMGRNSRPPPPPPQQRNARSRSPRRNGPPAQRGGANQGQGQGQGFKAHHTNVPRKTDLADKFSSNGPPTTGMLRNIPNKYDQKMLLDELHEAGFENTYDFFYLPMDVRNNANVGYAFINFSKPEDFERFSKGFQGHQFKQGGKRTAAVSPAVVQGFSANVRNLAKKKVTAGNFRPLVIKDGVSMSLEDAAKDLKEDSKASTKEDCKASTKEEEASTAQSETTDAKQETEAATGEGEAGAGAAKGGEEEVAKQDAEVEEAPSAEGEAKPEEPAAEEKMAVDEAAPEQPEATKEETVPSEEAKAESTD